ncbi:MAG: hypothetical protein IJC17_05585 [Clostridia bacterium]|nr:hypothetical protein [Clostridia bacterium]
MTTSEKVAYLKGLAEGMGLTDADTKEAKVLNAIIDVLNDMALDMEDLGEELTEIGEQVDEIDEDLADVEDLLYEDDDEDEDFDFADDLFEVTCPHCNADFEVDEEDLLADDGIDCPICGEKLTFDIEECDGDCSCCDEDCDNKE